MIPMGSVLFVTWHGGGNVNPVVALGHQLEALGHEVHVLATTTLRGRFADAGLRFVGRDPAHEWELSTMADDVTAACEGLRPDVVVVDYMLPAALCATEAAGLPTVALVHTLYGALLVDGTVGPMSMAASVSAVNAVRAEADLAPVTRLGELLRDVARVVVTAPPSLDTVLDELPVNVTYVGPVFEDAASDDEWQPPDAPGPLVVVSLGTTDMDELPVLERVLEALAHERARIVATVGEHADPSSILTPPNATVTGFVQHAAVLPHADLVITHGGLGTGLAALAHGLPVLCIPLGRDQPVNAAAIARTGAGKVLGPAATPGQIARAVNELLSNPSFRDAARRFAATLPVPGARHRAADIIAALAD